MEPPSCDHVTLSELSVGLLLGMKGGRGVFGVPQWVLACCGGVAAADLRAASRLFERRL